VTKNYIRLASQRVAPVLVAFLGGAILLGTTLSEARPWPKSSPRTGWCGKSVKRDWVCRWHGSTVVNGSPLRRWKPRRLQRKRAIVSTGQRSSARLALRGQARCTVGDRAPSEVVTRPGGNVLLRQLRGESLCSTRRRAGFELCGKRGCDTDLEIEGTAFALELPEEATSSQTESFHRRIRIVSCSGFISVRTAGQFASGGAKGRNRFVIEIDEYSYRTEDEVRVETPTEIRVEAQATAGEGVEVIEIGELPGRGPCKARFVREQERSIRN
jgi:hypothetical protein